MANRNDFNTSKPQGPTQASGDNSATKANPAVRFARYLFPMPGDKTTEIIRKLVFLISVIALCVSLGIIISDAYEQSKIDKQEKENDTFFVEITQPPSEEQVEYVRDVYENGDDIQEDMIKPAADYKDYRGILDIPGTNVKYPVFQAQETSEYKNSYNSLNDRYLRYDRDENYLIAGEIFVDYRCTIEPDKLSPNTIIYGHNMFQGDTYFTDLVQYVDLDYYQNSPVVYFDTLYHDYTWKIFSVFITNTTEEYGEVWKYHNGINLYEESQFNEYIDNALERSILDIPVDVEYGDYILTLSTCHNTYFAEDWRFVVMARMVRSGENPDVDVSAASVNEDVLMPDAFYEKYGTGTLPF